VDGPGGSAEPSADAKPTGGREGRTDIRLGINLLCLTDRVRPEHDGALARLREVGWDGVEVPILSGQPTEYERLGERLDALGLDRTATAIVPSTDADPTSADPAVQARGAAHLGWALDCAIALGAQSLGGPFHAPLGHFTGQGPTEGELARGAESHRVLAERASRHGLILSLEVLNRFETHFLNTAEQARAYAERVAHPAFRIMHDTFHANIEERDPLEAPVTLGRHLGVLHVSENDRGIPGRGHIDFASVFGRLRRSGWDGWVVMEAFGSGLPDIAAATRVWRPLFPDLDTLWTEGHAFIRRTWEAAAP
jgi:D-psicose/D-tagatose/L-ribulose 3-epimerase